MEGTPEFYFVSHGPESDPFWAAVVDGMETASSLYGVESRYVAPDSYEGDPGDRLRRVLDEESPDGLAVTLTDPVRMEGPVTRALNREGIPVVVVNVPDDREESSRIPYEYYVGMDERMCGERLAQATTDRADAVERAFVVVHEPGHTGLERRVEGLRSVLAERGVDLRVVEDNRQDAIRDAVAEDRGRADAADTYFSLGPHATEPMFEYFRRHDLLDEVTFSVTDGLSSLDAAEEYIRQEQIACSVEQDPFLQGFLPTLKLFELTAGDRRLSGGPETYLMGPDVVDRYSVDKQVQNQIIREELIGSIEQLNDDEKERLIAQLNAKFEEHQSMAVVGAQVVATLLPHLL
jgi:simple sugar transport system substrate-binding protein